MTLPQNYFENGGVHPPCHERSFAYIKPFSSPQCLSYCTHLSTSQPQTLSAILQCKDVETGLKHYYRSTIRSRGPHDSGVHQPPKWSSDYVHQTTTTILYRKIIAVVADTLCSTSYRSLASATTKGREQGHISTPYLQDQAIRGGLCAVIIPNYVYPEIIAFAVSALSLTSSHKATRVFQHNKSRTGTRPYQTGRSLRND